MVFCEGFEDDCLDLISSYVAKNTTDFDTFCDIWKKMNFHYIFLTISNLQELVEQIENYFIVLKNLFIKLNTTTEKTCVLYLLYAVYFKQPTKDFGKIRVTYDDWTDVKSFYDKIHADPTFLPVRAIFWRLWHGNAFRFVATEREQTYESMRSNRNQNPKVINFEKINSIHQKTSALLNDSKRLMNATDILQVGYNEMKEHLTKTVDECSGLTDTNITQDLMPQIELIDQTLTASITSRARKQEENDSN